MKKIKLMKETFLSIIDGSTVHGLPNIFRTTLIILKLIWFLSTTVSVLACAFFILQSINDYLNFDFVTNIESDNAKVGLSEDTVRFISAKKNEPEWMLEWRLKAYKAWLQMTEPTWPNVHYPKIDYQKIIYALTKEWGFRPVVTDAKKAANALTGYISSKKPPRNLPPVLRKFT